jgi:hypothetical protein
LVSWVLFIDRRRLPNECTPLLQRIWKINYTSKAVSVTGLGDHVTGCQPYALIGHPLSPGLFLVLISVRG